MIQGHERASEDIDLASILSRGDITNCVQVPTLIYARSSSMILSYTSEYTLITGWCGYGGSFTWAPILTDLGILSHC
jgi:hypothetical protein